MLDYRYGYEDGVNDYLTHIQAILISVKNQLDALEENNHLSRLALISQIQILDAAIANGKALLTRR